MRLGDVNESQFRQTPPEAGVSATGGVLPGSESRALVALAPLQSVSGQPAGHRHAPFVAHLVATKDQHPQTRERRRADLHEALAAYRAAAALTI